MDRDAEQRGEEEPAPALSRAVDIVNRRGLHARAAARLARLAEGFDADITVSAKGYTVSALSIMGLMMLAAGPGTQIVITCTGNDAEAALASICGLVEAGFQED